MTKALSKPSDGIMNVPKPTADAIAQFVADIHEATPGGAQEPVCVRRLAEQWAAHRLRPGDLVVIAMPNGAALLGHFFAAIQAGLVPALVAPSLPSARMRELLQALEARALVASRLDPEAFGARRLETIGTAEAVLLPEPQQPPTAAGEVVLLTSGTSGMASGCVFPFERLLLNASRHADAIGLRSGDRVLVNLPLYFSYALVAQAMASLVRGAHLVVSGPPFHAPSVFAWLGEHAVTVSSLTPILVRALLEQQAEFPGTLRVVTVGGDSLAPRHVEALLHQRPEGELYLTYGLTEAGPRVATLAAHAEPPERYASVGLPLEGTEVFLEPEGDARQLFVRSATTLSRRIGLVEGRPRGLRDDGALATGDLFDMDSDGYLFFRRRLGDFVVRGGEKICLASVRRLATTLPGVLSARTRVVGDRAGHTDFELTLAVAPQWEERRDDLRIHLRKLLRPGELPGRFSVIPADAHAGHK